MVEYKLIDIDEEGRLVYEYWIDNEKDRKGLATLDPETGEAQVTRMVEGGVGWHERHLLNSLRRQWRSGNKEPDSGWELWY